MTKKDRFMMDAAEDIEPEFQVAHIIKQIRVMKGLIKEKMSEETWKEGYQKYSLFQVELEDLIAAEKEFGQVEQDFDKSGEVVRTNRLEDAAPVDGAMEGTGLQDVSSDPNLLIKKVEASAEEINKNDQ